MFLMLLAIVSLYGLQGCTAVLDIETTTTYINSQVEVIYNPGDAYIFTAPTCGYYDTGYDVTVEVYNPHNPTNNPDVGITYFAVTNKTYNGTIPSTDIICSVDRQSTYSTSCTGLARKGDIYVHVTSNNKYDINFALKVTFSVHNPLAAHSRATPRPFHFPSLKATTSQELRQVINYGRQIELPFRNRTLIHLRICPSSITTNNFEVTSILQAADNQSESIIAQAICTTAKCNFDTTPKQGYVGGNSRDLPVNVATTDKADEYKDLYIYAVAYNGVLKHGWPIGMFIFGATITPK